MKLDMEIAFHRSGPAKCKVCVQLPKHSKLRNVLRLLLVSGYVLINASLKRQSIFDNAFAVRGLQQFAAMP